MIKIGSNFIASSGNSREIHLYKECLSFACFISGFYLCVDLRGWRSVSSIDMLKPFADIAILSEVVFRKESVLKMRSWTEGSDRINTVRGHIRDSFSLCSASISGRKRPFACQEDSPCQKPQHLETSLGLLALGCKKLNGGCWSEPIPVMFAMRAAGVAWQGLFPSHGHRPMRAAAPLLWISTVLSWTQQKGHSVE